MQKLMFIIDEGIGGSELISLYKDDLKTLDRMLTNIYEGLSPLKLKFEVVLLIYPTWFYDEKGGAHPSERICPELKHVFEFFRGKGMNIYLEIHSSGIRTNQNGELGTLPEAPLHYGSDKRWKSLPMDMETLEWLKSEYGEVFEGVRFHELVGSHEIGVHDRARGREETSHAFVVQDEVMRGIIDTVDRCGLRLVWGDHSFNLVAERSEEFGCFREWLDYAADRLGGDRLTLNWANNGWPMHKYITGKFAFKNYRGAATGMSVQSWFWQEADSSTMRVLGADGKPGIKWHAYAEMECPPELMAAYTLKYLSEGCSLVQYEPAHYFFNFYRPGRPLVEFRGNVERQPDYTLRLLGKRFIRMLLEGVEFSVLPEDYFDADAEKFAAYREGRGGKRYCQNTLTAVYPDGSVRCWDTYNDDPTRITEDSADRFLPEYFEGLRSFAAVRNGYSGNDQTLFYYGEDRVRTVTTRQGIENEFTLPEENIRAVVPFNMLSEYVESTDGDCDELLVFCETEGRLHCTAYRAVSESDSLMREYRYEKLKALPRAAEALDGIPAAALLNIVRVRDRNSVLIDSTRPPDRGVLAVYKTAEGINISGTLDGKSLSREIALPAPADAVCAADTDCDFSDGLAVAAGGSIYMVDLCGFTLSAPLIQGCGKPALLASHRTSFNQKAFDIAIDKADNALLN